MHVEISLTSKIITDNFGQTSVIRVFIEWYPVVWFKVLKPMNKHSYDMSMR